MAHAVSALYSKFNRMSPAAAALALLLHALVGGALFWESPLKAEAAEEAIEFTVDVPPPPPGPPKEAIESPFVVPPPPPSDPPTPEAPPAQAPAQTPRPQPSPPVR